MFPFKINNFRSEDEKEEIICEIPAPRYNITYKAWKMCQDGSCTKCNWTWSWIMYTTAIDTYREIIKVTNKAVYEVLGEFEYRKHEHEQLNVEFGKLVYGKNKWLITKDINYWDVCARLNRIIKQEVNMAKNNMWDEAYARVVERERILIGQTDCTLFPQRLRWNIPNYL